MRWRTPIMKSRFNRGPQWLQMKVLIHFSVYLLILIRMNHFSNALYHQKRITLTSVQYQTDYNRQIGSDSHRDVRCSWTRLESAPDKPCEVCHGVVLTAHCTQWRWKGEQVWMRSPKQRWSHLHALLQLINRIESRHSVWIEDSGSVHLTSATEPLKPHQCLGDGECFATPNFHPHWCSFTHLDLPTAIFSSVHVNKCKRNITSRRVHDCWNSRHELTS